MTASLQLEPDDLPDVGTLPPFQSLVSDGTDAEDFASGAYVVTDFVLSQKRWGSTFPPLTIDAAGRPQTGSWTLERVLSNSIQDWSCIRCGNKGDKCLGAQCVQDFRQNSQNVLDSLEIRNAGKMNFGVFCKDDNSIPAGSILGEYIGEVRLRKAALYSA